MRATASAATVMPRVVPIATTGTAESAMRGVFLPRARKAMTHAVITQATTSSGTAHADRTSITQSGANHRLCGSYCNEAVTRERELSRNVGAPKKNALRGGR